MRIFYLGVLKIVNFILGLMYKGIELLELMIGSGILNIVEHIIHIIIILSSWTIIIYGNGCVNKIEKL